MKEYKLKDIENNGYFFRKNYKEYAFKFAWQKSKYKIEGKRLVFKMKSHCAQDLMNDEETVYR